MEEGILSDLLEQQRHQTEAITRIAASTEVVARDFYTFLSGTMQVLLVYPWAHDLRVVRAVLAQSSEEERRLKESLDHYDKTDKAVPLEQWLKKEGFRLLATKQLNVGRQHTETFAAAAGTHRGLEAPSTPRLSVDAAAPLELERPGQGGQAG